MNRLTSMTAKTGLPILMVLGVCIAALSPADSQACGWVHTSGGAPGISRTDWMSALPGSLRLSELSIPGTHDSMSRCGGPAVKCQSMKLGLQLQTGVRALDIRLRRYQNHLDVTHKCFMQGDDCGDITDHYEFDDALCICVDFLKRHPDETILMRVKQEPCSFSPFISFEAAFKNYLNQGCDCGPEAGYEAFKDYIWSDPLWSYNDSLPTLDDVRGKIVFLQDFAASDSYGPRWSTFDIQDEYEVYYVCHGKRMDSKWSHIWRQIDDAIGGDSDQMYVNFTSASGGINPIDVARGLTVFWCFAYEQGMNRRLGPYLRGKPDQCRLGVVMMDFPGAGLTDLIISKNGLPSSCFDDPPIADAGGPYTALEGSAIAFDASDSSDPEDGELIYSWELWNFEMEPDTAYATDMIMSTGWHDAASTSYTLFDNDTYLLKLSVQDNSQLTDDDATLVTVTNVIPSVSIDSVVSPVRECILPGQELSFFGSFADPGVYDTHEAAWSFGDGTTTIGDVNEEHVIPDATGTTFEVHVYTEPGTYTLALEIEDNDGDIGTDSITMRVLTAVEAVAFANGAIQELPSSCFRGQARQRKNALSEKLTAVGDLIALGDLTGAVQKLMCDVRAKTDGSIDGHTKNDWITDQQAQAEVCLIVDELIEYLGLLGDQTRVAMVEKTSRTSRRIPMTYTLSQNYPNPFNARTTIVLSLPERANYRISIFNAEGRLVRLFHGSGEHGHIPIVWNGMDQSGIAVSSGLYLYTAHAGSFTETKKMLLVK